MNTAYRFEREPFVQRDRSSLWLWTPHLIRSRTTGRCTAWSEAVRSWRRLELQVRLDTARPASHHVGRHPARVLQLGLNLLSAHFLDDIRYADPLHANRKKMVSRLVVHCDFDLVRLVNRKVVYFVDPLVVARWLCAALDRIFYLDVNESLRSPTKATGGGVVDVGNGEYAKREMSAKRLSLAGDVEAVICARCQIL